MATHCSTLAWRIPWMEEPGGLQSTGSQRVGHVCSSEVISTILSSSSLIHSSASDILLLIPSGVFLISVIVFSLHVYSLRSLLIDSCIFSVLLSRFLIIFTIIIMNYFPDSLPISSSFIWTSVFLVCSFICVVVL